MIVPAIVLATGMYFVWTRGWSLGPVSIGGKLVGTILGLILAALGGSLVTLYKPAPGPAPHQVTAPAKPLAGSSSAGAIPQT